MIGDGQSGQNDAVHAQGLRHANLYPIRAVHAVKAAKICAGADQFYPGWRDNAARIGAAGLSARDTSLLKIHAIGRRDNHRRINGPGAVVIAKDDPRFGPARGRVGVLQTRNFGRD